MYAVPTQDVVENGTGKIGDITIYAVGDVAVRKLRELLATVPEEGRATYVPYVDPVARMGDDGGPHCY